MNIFELLFRRKSGVSLSKTDSPSPSSYGGETPPRRLDTQPKRLGGHGGSLGGVSVEAQMANLGSEDAFNMLVSNNLLADLFMAATQIGNTRREQYREYDLMEESVLISSALELVTDDACQRDPERGMTVWSKEGDYREDIEEFFLDIDLEDNVWGWIYQAVKYGDYHIKPHIEDGVGVVWVRDDIHPSDIWRIDINGKLMGFAYTDTFAHKYARSGTADYGSATLVDSTSFIHFIFNYRPSYEKLKVRVDREDIEETLRVGETSVESRMYEASQKYRSGGSIMMEEEDGNFVTLIVSSKGGSSFLYNVRKDYKILNLVEQSLALGRLSRSSVARVFYINTTGASVRERQSMIEEVKRQFTKRESFNATTDLYKSEYSPIHWLDDIFLPVAGDKGDVNVQQIGGDLDVKSIVDIDYFLNKIFSGIRIPKAFLGYEEAMPGFSGSGSLITLDMRYAKMIKKIQRCLIEGLRRLVKVHLDAKYGIDVSLTEIQLAMSPISSAEELSRIEAQNTKIEMANNIVSFVQNIGGDVAELGKKLYGDYIDVDVPLEDIFIEKPDEEEEEPLGEIEPIEMSGGVEPSGGMGMGEMPEAPEEDMGGEMGGFGEEELDL